MTGRDWAWMGPPHGVKQPDDSHYDIVPPDGISLREAFRAVASGRATLQPTGVAIVYADGRRYRQIPRDQPGHPGLMPEADEGGAG